MKKNTLFKNTIYKSILSLVNIVIPIIIGPYIVRLLDVNLYGTYNRVLSEFQIFLAFASFGVYNYGVREISRIRNDKKATSKLFSNLFLISLFSNILVLIIYHNTNKMQKEFGGISYQQKQYPLGEILAELAFETLQTKACKWQELKPLYIQPPPMG